MTETTLDSYLSKFSDIQTASIDNTTTSSAMQTLYNDLVTIETTLDTEIANPLTSVPSTSNHLNKFILVQNARQNRFCIIKALYDFVKTRCAKHKVDVETEETQETLMAYVGDTNDFEIFLKNLFNDHCIKEIIRLSKIY